jgi:hypothetical protein
MIKTSLNAMNPVSVIALFAGLSEASAATALPFLDEDNRDIYVWFLIIFPCTLTFLFFLTLNFNYKVLYAPSDFSNEKNFLKIIKNNEFSLKNEKDDDKALNTVKPVKHHPHRSVPMKSGPSNEPPDGRFASDTGETPATHNSRPRSLPALNFRSYSATSLQPAHTLHVMVGGPISCTFDIEQLLSLLKAHEDTAHRADVQAIRLILLIKDSVDPISNSDFMSLLERIPRHARRLYTFAVLTPDADDALFL